MNLQNLKVVELEAQELKETEGGIWPLLVIAALCCGGCAATREPVKSGHYRDENGNKRDTIK